MWRLVLLSAALATAGCVDDTDGLVGSPLDPPDATLEAGRDAGPTDSGRDAGAVEDAALDAGPGVDAALGPHDSGSGTDCLWFANCPRRLGPTYTASVVAQLPRAMARPRVRSSADLGLGRDTYLVSDPAGAFVLDLDSGAVRDFAVPSRGPTSAFVKVGRALLYFDGQHIYRRTVRSRELRGEWTLHATLSSVRREGRVLYTGDRRLLVVGGEGGSAIELGDSEGLNWTVTDRLPPGRVVHTVVEWRHVVWLLGGLQDGRPTASTYRLRPPDYRLEPGPDLVAPRARPAASVIYQDGRVLVTGSGPPDAPFAEYRTRDGFVPVAGRDGRPGDVIHSTCSGRHVAMGGAAAGEPALLEFEPCNNRWSPIPVSFPNRTGATVFTSDHALIVVGGESLDGTDATEVWALSVPYPFE